MGIKCILTRSLLGDKHNYPSGFHRKWGWLQDDRKGSSLLYTASLPRQFRADDHSDLRLWWIGTPGVFDQQSKHVLFASNLPEWGRYCLVAELQVALGLSLSVRIGVPSH